MPFNKPNQNLQKYFTHCVSDVFFAQIHQFFILRPFRSRVLNSFLQIKQISKIIYNIGLKKGNVEWMFSWILTNPLSFTSYQSFACFFSFCWTVKSVLKLITWGNPLLICTKSYLYVRYTVRRWLKLPQHLFFLFPWILSHLSTHPSIPYLKLYVC